MPDPDPAPPWAQAADPIVPPAVYRNGHSRLSESSERYGVLAGWLLANEMGREPNIPGVTAAAERICSRLFPHLSALFSPVGAQAILSRALHLARADFPFLGGLRVEARPGACLRGLDVFDAGVTPVQVGQGLRAFFRNLLELLAEFIGDDLALRLVREVWPELPLLYPRPPAAPHDEQGIS